MNDDKTDDKTSRATICDDIAIADSNGVGEVYLSNMAEFQAVYRKQIEAIAEVAYQVAHTCNKKQYGCLEVCIHEIMTSSRKLMAERYTELHPEGNC